mmetsp:Transcript_10966/g.15226  ORF Transcript_10966/g.15226 Transcript_10966/m.15226 type:complete len:223 (-) Transcript_10966:159-827(-)|eukprot:CAMPEP_0185726516 /NCGR_PEP_ID=MMETSP1171-20130828/2480_1 /TAXON_ID=374046 /ORGANISM="Helicotheca tamensis, Strain CCMP826" /LENGTH=222 /DNA_ID=CAMNT_0028394893 /DNA_START=15 /DNA_END=683 /DNA_ORIENTATION=-
MSGIAVLILSIIGFVLSSIAAFTCDFVGVNGYNWAWVTVGFVGYDDHLDWKEGCTGHNLDDVDSEWKAALAFAMIAFSFAFISLILSILYLCKGANATSYKCLSCLSIWVMLCQGLSLIALASDYVKRFSINDQVHIEKGAGSAIAAIVIFFILAVVASKTGGEEDHDETHGGAEPLLDNVQGDIVVTTTEKEMEDGTKIIEKVTTYPDGRKEITTTTETPV